MEVLAVENPTGSTVRLLTPQKYPLAETSGIVVDVDRPLDDLKIELTWAGEDPRSLELVSEGDVPNVTQ